MPQGTILNKLYRWIVDKYNGPFDGQKGYSLKDFSNGLVKSKPASNGSPGNNAATTNSDPDPATLNDN